MDGVEEKTVKNLKKLEKLKEFSAKEFKEIKNCIKLLNNCDNLIDCLIF